MRGPIIATTALATVALAVPAAAGANDADVKSAGKCSGSSTAKIKVKPDDGRLEVEFEVDQNKNGVRWKVRIKDNGKVAFRGSARTKGPSGSFSVEKRIDNQAGSDRVKGIGRNPATGERCVAKVSI